MACLDPITRSPGKLFLTYQDTGSSTVHKIGWHLYAGVDINGLGPLRIEANRLSNYLIACVTSVFEFLDWGVSTPTGHVFHQEPLTSFGPGTHAVAGGMQNWRSTTVCFVGRGTPGGPTGCSGRSISRLHIGGAINFRPGDKSRAAGLDAPFLAFITAGLNASSLLPADFYGQVALVGEDMPCQWNAHTQRRDGS